VQENLARGLVVLPLDRDHHGQPEWAVVADGEQVVVVPERLEAVRIAFELAYDATEEEVDNGCA
jgi:hypothetical protein